VRDEGYEDVIAAFARTIEVVGVEMRWEYAGLCKNSIDRCRGGQNSAFHPTPEFVRWLRAKHFVQDKHCRVLWMMT
jgi:hypothetical protein